MTEIQNYLFSQADQKYRVNEEHKNYLKTLKIKEKQKFENYSFFSIKQNLFVLK